MISPAIDSMADRTCGSRSPRTATTRTSSSAVVAPMVSPSESAMYRDSRSQSKPFTLLMSLALTKCHLAVTLERLFGNHNRHKAFASWVDA